LSVVRSHQNEQDTLKLDPDLDALVREGAWRMLLAALKAEVDEYAARSTPSMATQLGAPRWSAMASPSLGRRRPRPAELEI
jgi:hypothetical protein